MRPLFAALLLCACSQGQRGVSYDTASERANACRSTVAWVEQVEPDRWQALCPPQPCINRANQLIRRNGFVYDLEAYEQTINECAERL